MKPMRLRRPAAACAALLLLAACSGSGGGNAGAGDDLAVQVASFDLAVGPPSRFIVGLITADQRLVGFGTVDLRFSFVGTREDANNPTPFGPPVKASFLPIHGSVVPEPAPAAPQIVVASETRGLYSAPAGFDKAGFWEVEATATIDGKEVSGKGAFAVNEAHLVPAVGQPALATETLTLTTPDVPRAAIDSRGGSGEIPDPHLHRTTIAASLAAKRPIVAVFSTPVYCTSRFCGPVTDLVDELAHQYADRADFVHVEIWRDFQGKTVNRSAADWVLRNDQLNEPWVFVVGAEGRITARFDNVVTRGELEPLIQALPVIGPATS
jgi:hypothetical protein